MRAADGSVTVTAEGGLAEDAVVELGSVTKAVTGLLLADAVVRGEVALDTELADCLPGARAGITLGRLASHTAGLPRVPLALLRRVGFLDTTDPYAATTVAGAGGRPRAPSRIRRAGRPRYSNLGAALLGQALAARAGRSYERLATERVLAPLGAHRGLGARAARRPRSRTGAAAGPCRRGRWAPTRPRAASAARARGALALAAGCLDAAGRRSPTRWRSRCGAARAPPRPVGHGLGWLEARGMWWHNGGTNGSRAFVALRPESGRAVAAVANSRKAPDRAAVAQLNS